MKMKLLKIKSKYLIQNLFNFISPSLKLHIIYQNKNLNDKLDILYLKKRNFFKNKITNYQFNKIKEYRNQFKKDFDKHFKDENELSDFFYYGLSQKNNFNIKISDNNTFSLINHIYFEENLNIEIEDLTKEKIPRILLIEYNKFNKKALEVFNEIFNLFSINGKMTKTQILKFINKCFNKKFTEYQKISELFSSYLSNNEFLVLEGFYKFFIDIIIDDNKLGNLLYIIYNKELFEEVGLDIVWDILYNFGYNNMLEKNEYNLDYIDYNSEKFEKINKTFQNFLEISNKKIHKLIFLLYIDKIFIQHLNKKEVFKNIKIIEISIYHFDIFIKLNIIFPNVEELSFYINKNLKSNITQINYIFPNIKSLKLFIFFNINLIELLKNIEKSKVTDLIIIFSLNEKYNYSKLNSSIQFNNIINLRIDIDTNYCFINELFIEFFINIQFPNLISYILNFNMNKYKNNKRFRKQLYNDYNYINNFIIDILLFKYQFSFKSFFDLLCRLININFLRLNFYNFDFIYKRKEEEKYLFKFNINDEIEFKNYYLNFDLSIDSKEIKKYKKIDIQGLNKINNNLNEIEEIIENEGVNLCDINFSIGIKRYCIKSFKYINSIYCENEIEKTNLKELIYHKELENLKHINITIGYIKVLYKDIFFSDNHIYKFFIELIKKSKYLKSLILRIHSYNYKENINFILSLIEDLKQLKIVNISDSSSNFKYDISLEKLIGQFPNLNSRINYFKEFKINNIGFEKKSIDYIKINNKKYINTIKCMYNIKEIDKPIQILNKNGIIRETIHNGYCQLYFNNQKKNFCFEYQFPKKGEIEIKIKFIKTLKNLSFMFSGCSSLISLDLSNFNTNNVIDMNSIFSGCSSLISLDLSNFNTNNVNNMCAMFSGCSSLISLDLSNFNTNNVEDMNSMFSGCSSLKSLDLFNFNTDNVEDMHHMFYNCSSLASLNLYNFNINKVLHINHMFSGCSSLISLDLSNFKNNKIINMKKMFYNCSSLTYINLSNFITNKVNNMSFMFSGCSSLISLDLSNFNTNNVNNMGDMFSGCSSLNDLNLFNFKINKNIHFENIFNGLNQNCHIKSKDEMILKIWKIFTSY